MSLLPTPPSTLHRNKENLHRRRSSNSRVVWSQQNQIHTLQPNAVLRSHVDPSASKEPPQKSILKVSSLLPFDLNIDEPPKRATTPEPADPLVDLTYLQMPVETIIKADSTLRELIEAYSVLAARLRACVTDATDVDASWPLFQPFRKHRKELIGALKRDIGRALVDPSFVFPFEEEEATDVCCDDEDDKVLLPSPKSTPQKNVKKGMSAEQVKYARDLCTTTHAALKVLSVVFTLPAIYRVFEDPDLEEMLTAVISIPMAPTLPTPNARKTYALAIWLIQVQRLPAEVLNPAAPRIAHVLQRGIDGELGKEGKKGSVSDGLKAIHDLSIYLPQTFVPAFPVLLSSILSKLLGPTLVLRTQAAHALGGIAIASTALPFSEFADIRCRMANLVTTYLTTPAAPAAASGNKKPAPPPKKGSSSKSPSPTKATLGAVDSTIARTLKAALGAEDPAHPAAGPVWALCVLSSLIVLMGPMAILTPRAREVVACLLKLGLAHKKGSVRGLSSLVARVTNWVYFQPRVYEVSMGEEDGEGEEECTPPKPAVEFLEVFPAESKAGTSAQDAQIVNWVQARAEWWKAVIKGVVDMGAGVATAAALVGHLGPAESEEERNKDARKAFQVVKGMIKRGGQGCFDAMEIVKQLVSYDAAASSSKDTMEGEDADVIFGMESLLPPCLFSASPGLLTAEFKSLVTLVKPVLEVSPVLDAVRTFSREELAEEWSFNGLVEIWQEGIMCLEFDEEVKPPAEILHIWECLLRANVAVTQDARDHDGTTQFALKAVGVLIDILKNQDYDFIAKKAGAAKAEIPTSPVKASPLASPSFPRSNNTLKMDLIHQLWTATRQAIPQDCLGEAGSILIQYLALNEQALVFGTGDTIPLLSTVEQARAEWAALCAEVMLVCEDHELRAFWMGEHAWGGWNEEAKATVWKAFVDAWSQNESGTWERGVVLLAAPFVAVNSWEVDDEEACKDWQEFLQLMINKAVDTQGVDGLVVLADVVKVVSGNPSPTGYPRAAEMLLTYILQQMDGADGQHSWMDVSSSQILTDDVMGFVCDALTESYPPTPGVLPACIWLLRTLTNVVVMTDFPVNLRRKLLKSVQSGITLWIADEQCAFSDVTDYELNVLSLYEATLFAIDSLSKTYETLDIFSALVSSPFSGREDKPESIHDAFAEFWKKAYADLEAPQSGWPTVVSRCLGSLPETVGTLVEHLLPIMNNAEGDLHDEITCVEEALLFPDSDYDTEDEEEQDEVQPQRSALFESFAKPDAPFVTRSRLSLPTASPPTVLPLLATPQPPATPRRNSKTVKSSPSRPLKPMSVFQALPFAQSPGSPSVRRTPVPTTPKRTPRLEAPFSGSPNKRRKLGDKENESPCRTFASVEERIAMKSPSVLGKRSSSRDHRDEGPASKRGRIESPSLSHALDSAQKFLSDDVFSEREASSKRRRSLFMEIPAFREIIQQPRRRSFGSDSVLPSTLSSKMNRVVSFDTRVLSKKRKSCVDDDDTSDIFSDDLPILSSDDSILSKHSPAKPQQLSSDDDPHVGQVTPHHLISPAVRHAKLVDIYDPPSDDSTLSSSPSRGLGRRLQSIRNRAFMEVERVQRLKV